MLNTSDPVLVLYDSGPVCVLCASGSSGFPGRQFWKLHSLCSNRMLPSYRLSVSSGIFVPCAAAAYVPSFRLCVLELCPFAAFYRCI